MTSAESAAGAPATWVGEGEEPDEMRKEGRWEEDGVMCVGGKRAGKNMNKERKLNQLQIERLKWRFSPQESSKAQKLQLGTPLDRSGGPGGKSDLLPKLCINPITLPR